MCIRRTVAGRPPGTNRGPCLLTEVSDLNRLASDFNRFASAANRLRGRLRRPGDDRLWGVVTSSCSRCVLSSCDSGVSPLAPLASTSTVSVGDAGR
jgi:hypothetical protein